MNDTRDKVKLWEDERQPQAGAPLVKGGQGRSRRSLELAGLIVGACVIAGMALVVAIVALALAVAP